MDRLPASWVVRSAPPRAVAPWLRYNRCARIFNGPADGVDKVLDDMVWGDSTYAADHLVMKWNAEWDACNYLGTAEACAGAWTDNEWNGKIVGGSGAVWHYKIQWSAACKAGTPLIDGGYCGTCQRL